MEQPCAAQASLVILPMVEAEFSVTSWLVALVQDVVVVVLVEVLEKTLDGEAVQTSGWVGLPLASYGCCEFVLGLGVDNVDPDTN